MPMSCDCPQVRGGAGQLSGLTSGDLQEYADSIIDCAARYGPTTLSLQVHPGQGCMPVCRARRLNLIP